MTTQTIAAMLAPTAPQIAFVRDLTRTRDVSPGKSAEVCLFELDVWLTTGGPTRKAVSEMIDRAKAAPQRRALLTSVPAVPDSVRDSKYAFLTDTLVGLPDSWRRQEMLFVEVKKYRGRRVIRRLIGAPGAFSRLHLTADLQHQVLGLLGDDRVALEASTRFGVHYTCCGTCGAELTDDESRRLSQGPICRKRWGL